MAGFSDLFGGGGGMFGDDASGMFGMLTPEMKQQMAFRGLMAAAGAFGQAAMPSRMPVPIGAALGQAASAMSGAQDQGLENALKMMLTAAKVQESQSTLATDKALADNAGKMPAMFGPAAAPAPNAGTLSGAAPLGVQPGDSLGGGMAAGGALTGKVSDPRGLVPYIKETAAKYGIDPEVAVQVAQSEGLANPIGDGGKSGGAFQLYTGGGVGNEFQRDTGKSPLDLANEKDTIDYALRKASQVGWGPWHGAKRVGIAEWQGIGRGPDTVVTQPEGDIPAPVQVAQNGSLTSLPAAASAAQITPAAQSVVSQLPATLPPSAPAPLTPFGGVRPEFIQWSMLQSHYLARAKRPVPGWMSEAAALPLKYAEPGANPERQGQIAGAQAAAKYPYDERLKMLEAGLARETARQDKGLMTGQGGVIQEVPNYGQALAGVTGAVEGAKPTGEQKDYLAYEAGQKSRGLPALSFGDWDLTRRHASATNVSQKVEGQGQAALVNAGIKAMEGVHEAELAANKRTQLYGQMAEAMQGFTPGATAELRFKGESILKDLGIISGTNVPPAELFRQAGRHIQIAAQPKGQGAVSNFERELYAEAVPAMVNSPEGLVKAIDIGRRLDDYDRRVAQIHRDAAKENGGLPNYIEAQQRIAALGPPLSAGELSALDKLRKGEAAPGSITTPYGTIQQVR